MWAALRIAFCMLSVFIEARVDNFNVEIICSLVGGLIKNGRTNVGFTTVVFPIPLIVLDRSALRRKLFGAVTLSGCAIAL